MTQTVKRDDVQTYRDEVGRVFTEAVITIPLFLVVLLGIFDYSRIFTLNSIIEDAAVIAGRNAVIAEEITCTDSVAPEFASALDRFSYSGDARISNPPQVVVVSDQNLLQFEVRASLPCVTCSFLQYATGDALEVSRMFTFPVENPGNCTP